MRIIILSLFLGLLVGCTGSSTKEEVLQRLLELLMEEKKEVSRNHDDDVTVSDAKVITSSVAIDKEKAKKVIEKYQPENNADGGHLWRIRLITYLDGTDNGFILERSALGSATLTEVIDEIKTNGIIKENQANASKKAAEDMTSTSYGLKVKVMYHPPRTLVAIRGDGKPANTANKV